MKAHVCIGGPLDGLHACSDDFTARELYGKEIIYTGRYADLRDMYIQFNNANRTRHPFKKEKPRAAVAWIYVPLLLPSITLVERMRRENT